MTRRLSLFFGTIALWAHPMGNFSVNHYARIDLNPGVGRITYVLDLAEIPTFELFQQWKVDEPQPATIQAKAQLQAKDWLANLAVTENGQAIALRLRTVKSQAVDGAGGMPVLRVEMLADFPLSSGRLHYQDRNFPSRAGWKEIVIRRGNGVAISQSSQSGGDLSKALTEYPADPTVAPPQQLEASATFNVMAIPPVTAAPSLEVVPKLQNEPFVAPQPIPAGTVVRGDYLSRLLKNQDLSLGMILLGLGAAFGLGAMHALSPGHGKTIVAAYLVGSRGTLKHALFLGGMVTFTHTLSVFLLGLGVLFFQQYVVPERIIPLLGAISGFSIVCIGGYLLYQRTLMLAGHGHHHHDHTHEPETVVTESVPGQPAFLSKVDYQRTTVLVHSHTHDGHSHSHAMPDAITLRGLVVLGASGGLVPCPSALVLMLSSIALGHTALGLTLLVAFSAGLALVLMAIGGIVIYAKDLLPESTATHPFFRFVPILSAVAVMILGVLMTMTSLGWVQTPLAG